MGTQSELNDLNYRLAMKKKEYSEYCNKCSVLEQAYNKLENIVANNETYFGYIDSDFESYNKGNLQWRGNYHSVVEYKIVRNFFNWKAAVSSIKDAVWNKLMYYENRKVICDGEVYGLQQRVDNFVLDEEVVQ